ncbi:Thiazole synthase [Planctomyces sp. SH-PL62]|nr:Thiazole synthase [Planctomyces sp. SH-PL62]
MGRSGTEAGSPRRAGRFQDTILGSEPLARGRLESRNSQGFIGGKAGRQAVESIVEITLNGQKRDVPDALTVARLLGLLELKPEHVAVERNRDLVTRSRHEETEIDPGDEIEIVTLVGGGAPDEGSPAPAPLTIGSHTVRSRLFVGTGKYTTLELMRECLEASGADVVTVAVRRERLFDREGRNLLDFVDPARFTILPNTAGCYNAEDSLRTARLGRELLQGLGNPGADWVKLEVLADPRTLLPDPVATLESTKVLVAEGFQVLCYTSDDPIMARRLKEAGAAAVMPAGSPIGSGQGVLNPNNIRIILEDLKADDPSYPVIIDAGVGTASDVALAMELGCDGVLLNTGIAGATDPLRMAHAMRLAVEAGRLAAGAGRIPRKLYATASSPTQGMLGRN